jgi:undecaprenyl-diphosphatase
MGAMRDELTALDQAVFDAVADTPTPSVDRWVVALSDAANYSRLWMGIATCLAAAGGRTGRRAAVSGMLAVGLASAVTNLGLKPLAGRRRPAPSDGAGVSDSRRVRRPESASFPSGHTASAFAFAAAAAGAAPAASLPLHVLATLVGYSRVHTGMHYPSDIAAGAVVGVVCGRAVRRLSGVVRPRSLADRRAA